jgi:hypothetical protein
LVISPYTYCGAFLIGYSTDGSDFTFPTQWSGSTGQAWQQEQVDLSSWYDQGSQSTVNLLGDSRVWIALSSSVTQPTWANSTEGSYVDDMGLGVTIADSTPPVTTASGCDANWHDTAVTVHFGATDNAGGSGVDYTEFSTDGGSDWTQGDSVQMLAPADHSGDGLHTILYKSVDNAGNWETAKTVTVKIDTTRPTVSATGLQASPKTGWQKTGSVSLTANDALSGVATTCYTVDSGPVLTYGGPFPVTSQGSHAISYWAVDAAGNSAATQTGYLDIDSRAPAAAVKALTVKTAAAKKGKTLKISVTIADPKPSCGSARLVLVLTGAKNKKLAALAFKSEPTNTVLTLSDKLTRSLAKGSYSITVMATDAAGNVQAKAGKAKLTVK